MLKKEFKNDTNELLKNLSLLPYNYHNDNTIIEKIFHHYIKINKEYEKYYNYFSSFWLKYFNNNILNYNIIDKKYRANSYIENYNRQLKKKLSQLIYGKDKSYLSWPLFIKFIQNEEEYRRDNNNLENSIIKKI